PIRFSIALVVSRKPRIEQSLSDSAPPSITHRMWSSTLSPRWSRSLSSEGARSVLGGTLPRLSTTLRPSDRIPAPPPCGARSRHGPSSAPTSRVARIGGEPVTQPVLHARDQVAAGRALARSADLGRHQREASVVTRDPEQHHVFGADAVSVCG